MKKLLSLIICFALLCSLFGCSNDPATNSASTATDTDITESPTSPIKYEGNEIIGTWMCKNISKDCYFIFDENGDAYAKWGTTTVYGYYDFYEEDGIYDIEITNFLMNEYVATFDKDKMTLSSDETAYNFVKATMPEITIKAPDNLVIDKKLVGNWQSADSFQYFEFHDDCTAIIRDIFNLTTVECKYSCKNGVATFYAMSNENKENVTEREYSFTSDGKLEIDGYIYETVQQN